MTQLGMCQLTQTALKGFLAQKYKDQNDCSDTTELDEDVEALQRAAETVCQYDVCIATLSVYPHRASLKNMPGHGGIRACDLWNASPMLCQLSYAVRSVRARDISELSLVPSISM